MSAAAASAVLGARCCPTHLHGMVCIGVTAGAPIPDADLPQSSDAAGQTGSTQAPSAATAANKVHPVMKIRMSEPTVHKVARVSWVRAVR
jgi:hypothetical protein